MKLNRRSAKYLQLVVRYFEAFKYLTITFGQNASLANLVTLCLIKYFN